MAALRRSQPSSRTIGSRSSRGIVLLSLMALAVYFCTRLSTVDFEISTDSFGPLSSIPVVSPSSSHASLEIADSFPPDWLWKPLEEKCVVNASIPLLDPFPPIFEEVLYVRKYGDKVGREERPDLEHFNRVGRSRGWIASTGQNLRPILNSAILPKLAGKKLEIGPYLRPLLEGDDIKYFDVLDLEGLRARANATNFHGYKETEIDYVDPSGNIDKGVPDKESFVAVVSSHVVEHQLDLVRHLNAVSNLLISGGYYILFVPDKRYCFDHYVPITSIADVLEDYYEDRYHTGTHKLRSALEHRAITVHNNAANHWKGIHGPEYSPFSGPKLVEKIKASLHEFEKAKEEGKYLDVHNYQFVPQTLAGIIDTLNALELTPMRVHRLYETIEGSVEFTIVLRKCGEGSNAAI